MQHDKFMRFALYLGFYLLVTSPLLALNQRKLSAGARGALIATTQWTLLHKRIYIFMIVDLAW